jgi:hypothetical protein
MTRKQKPEPSDHPSPSPRMLARIAEAKRRNAERLERPSVELKLKPEGEKIVAEINVARAGRETMLDAFGTTSMDFVQEEVERLSNYHRAAELSDRQHQRDLNAAIAVIDGTRPDNEAAAMLASQMAVTHALAMDMMGRAKRAELVVQADSAGSMAVKLLRTYTTQIEALAKLKRGGEQTVRVEHVHVYPGGQAIVGAVSNHRRAEGGGVDEYGNQAFGTLDPRTLTSAPGAALLGPNAVGDAMPEARGERQEALPPPRRR